MADKQTHKLTTDEQLQVCRWIAEFRDDAEVATLCQEQFGKRISHQNIYGSYRKADRWIETIDRLREEYRAGLMEEPIANLRVQLQRLEHIYQEAMQGQEVTKEGHTYTKRELATAINALRHAHEAVYGKRLQVQTEPPALIQVTDDFDTNLANMLRHLRSANHRPAMLPGN